MPAILGPALVAAALLSLAGAQKVLDPAMTVGALRALHLPSSPMLVRAGSAVELAIGAGAIAGGGSVLWALVALSYVSFSVIVVAALRAGTMLGTCGCFGREDTPPHASHVVLNLGLAAASGLPAIAGRAGITELPSSSLARLGIGALLALALVLVYKCYIELPRLFSAEASVRELDLTRVGSHRAPHADRGIGS